MHTCMAGAGGVMLKAGSTLSRGVIMSQTHQAYRSMVQHSGSLHAVTWVSQVHNHCIGVWAKVLTCTQVDADR